MEEVLDYCDGNHGCPCRGNGDMDDCGVDRYDALDEADKEAVGV